MEPRLIPFLEHDDANRALMGANMQKQAVLPVQPRAPIIGTGVELQAARDSGHALVSRHDGEVVDVSAREITIRDDDGRLHLYNLQKFVSFQSRHMHQPATERPQGRAGQRRTRFWLTHRQLNAASWRWEINVLAKPLCPKAATSKMRS